MELTDERVIPKSMNPKNGMLREHIARYKFASTIAKGRVLDMACGVGYGSEMLAQVKNVQEVVAVDIDQETLDYAKDHYQHPKTRYYQGLAEDSSLYIKLGCFDTIVSMETIEHIEDDYGFITNVITLLKPGGLAIISTPFGRGRDYECSCPYHYRQYTEDEFKELLNPFREVELYHQLNEVIEKPIADKKYYLMVAVCKL